MYNLILLMPVCTPLCIRIINGPCNKQWVINKNSVTAPTNKYSLVFFVSAVYTIILYFINEERLFQLFQCYYKVLNQKNKNIKVYASLVISS